MAEEPARGFFVWREQIGGVYSMRISCVTDRRHFPWHLAVDRYLVYVEGHCAACRYGFMMRLGSVILKAWQGRGVVVVGGKTRRAAE